MFKRSNKTQRTPEGVEKMKESGVEEMLRGWREEMGGDDEGIKRHDGLEREIEADKGGGSGGDQGTGKVMEGGNKKIEK